MEINFPTAIQENPAKLTRNINTPSAPKKCMGLRENRDMKPMVIKIQKAVDEAFKAKLGGTILARLMLDHLLSDAIETSALRQNGNVAVHFSLHFDGLHDFESVCL